MTGTLFITIIASVPGVYSWVWVPFCLSRGVLISTLRTEEKTKKKEGRKKRVRQGGKKKGKKEGRKERKKEGRKGRKKKGRKGEEGGHRNNNSYNRYISCAYVFQSEPFFIWENELSVLVRPSLR
jgi:hypothetical protein